MRAPSAESPGLTKLVAGTRCTTGSTGTFSVLCAATIDTAGVAGTLVVSTVSTAAPALESLGEVETDSVMLC